MISAIDCDSYILHFYSWEDSYHLEHREITHILLLIFVEIYVIYRFIAQSFHCFPKELLIHMM